MRVYQFLKFYNTEMFNLYWNISDIMKIQSGDERACYGDAVLLKNHKD